jgi:internalin A
MANSLEKQAELTAALVSALGSYDELEEILADLAEIGASGLAIRNRLKRTNALETDCRRLIRLSRTYSNGLACLQMVLKQHLQHKAAWADLEQALIAHGSASETTDSPSTPGPAPIVYISYAWGDSSPEGQRRARLVDQLCEAIKAAGIDLRIDREQVKPGDRISAFMNAIASGEVVIIILSRKYLESEYCLYELNGIWKQASQEADRFLQRVIPLTLPDANLKATEELFMVKQFWAQRWQNLREQIREDPDSVDRELFAKSKDIQKFSQHIGDILVLLNDKCEPPNFDQQAKEGFREVIAQILAVGEQ